MERTSISPPLAQRHRVNASSRPIGMLETCTQPYPMQQVQQVQQVCDHLLATLRADGCFIEQAPTVTAFAHALACWRGTTIVLKADGPTPDLLLPRTMPLFALELWSGTLAIVYHADLAPARQTIGILHVLAHFLLLWGHPLQPFPPLQPLQAEAWPPSDHITCAYRFLPSQERLQEIGNDALREHPTVQELTLEAWRHPRTRQIHQSASHRAAPERGVGIWESAWEPYAIELTRRFLRLRVGEPMRL